MWVARLRCSGPGPGPSGSSSPLPSRGPHLWTGWTGLWEADGLTSGLLSDWLVNLKR